MSDYGQHLVCWASTSETSGQSGAYPSSCPPMPPGFHHAISSPEKVRLSRLPPERELSLPHAEHAGRDARSMLNGSKATTVCNFCCDADVDCANGFTNASLAFLQGCKMKRG